MSDAPPSSASSGEAAGAAAGGVARAGAAGSGKSVGAGPAGVIPGGIAAGGVRVGPHEISDLDIHLFCEGTHARIYEKLGAHVTTREGVSGTQFAVWAPNAQAVSVVGDFNAWKTDATPLQRLPTGGVWSGFVPGIAQGQLYKYRITSRAGHLLPDKADPHGVAQQPPPETASVVWNLDYAWQDQRWMSERSERNVLSAPMSVYEVHLGSWMRVAQDGYRSLGYCEIAPRLIEHIKRLGFTHAEFLPVMEHPFFGSWGYQVTGFFAPSARYGSPQDFMSLIDALHQNGIGVILDWVPAHFPSDGHGPVYFDGTHLYEHDDPRQREHPEWGSVVFNYGRLEVQSFLTSSAVFWLDKFHADGLRVDGVTSMLHLDYGRADGQWVPNRHGGRENLDAVSFLRRLNDAVHREYPDALTIAEEATAWPRVTGPTRAGGLGFDLKWDMGWMHDTLRYLAREPMHRRYHHDELTFRRMYAYSERYLLSLSHDEVVYGKGSLLGRMPGDEWQKFANLRLLFAYMLATPGKKLLFMGGEFGQHGEWNHDGSIDWKQASMPLSQGIQHLVRELNRVYIENPALYLRDHDPEGFDWIDANDSRQSTLSFLRRSTDPEESIVGVFNFTPEPRHDFRIGVDTGGYWHELINTDAKVYGGSGLGNQGGVHAAAVSSHGRPYSLSLTLPPLGALLLSRG
jgi:1,4-alpha-glucan branching enzyme